MQFSCQNDLAANVWIYPTNPPASGKDTKSKFKRNADGRVSVISFFQIGCFIKAKYPRPLDYLAIAE